MMAEATSSSDEAQEEAAAELEVGFRSFDFVIGQGRKLEALTIEEWAMLLVKVGDRIKTKLPHFGLSELHTLLSRDGITTSLIKALPASTRHLRVAEVGKKSTHPETNADNWPRVYLKQDGGWLLVQYVSKTLLAQPFTEELMIKIWSSGDIPWEINPRRMLYSIDLLLGGEAEKAEFHRNALLNDLFWVQRMRGAIDTLPPTPSLKSVN